MNLMPENDRSGNHDRDNGETTGHKWKTGYNWNFLHEDAWMEEYVHTCLGILVAEKLMKEVDFSGSMVRIFRGVGVIRATVFRGKCMFHQMNFHQVGVLRFGDSVYLT